MSQFISYPDNDKQSQTVHLAGEWLDMVEAFHDLMDIIQEDETYTLMVNDMEFYAFVAKIDNSEIARHYEVI